MYTVDLWWGFREFFYFSPKRQVVIFFLMLLQGITAGIGLLLLIPLLDVIGFKLGMAASTGISVVVSDIFMSLGLQASLATILLSYVFIIAAIASLRYQLEVRSSELQQRYICHLRNTLYRSLIRCSWQYIVQNKMSDFTHCLTGQVQTVGHTAQLMLRFLSQCVLSLVMIVLSFMLSWKMSLLALSFASGLFVLLLPINRTLYGSGKTKLTSFKTIFQMLTEQLASLKMIKSYGSENYYADKMLQASEVLETQYLRITRLNAITQWIYLVAGAAGFSIFLYVALSVVNTPLPTLLLLLIIFARLLPQIGNLHKSFQQLVHAIPALNDVESMRRNCHKAEEPSGLDCDYLELKNAISLEGVSYCYPQKEEAVFENISLRIKHKETVALIGHSGVGKTTLADLVGGLLVPTAGRIFCDEIELNDKNRLAWRRGLAYVTQDVYFFHDSIRANLNWVASNLVSDSEIWDALQLAAADEFVAALPKGLDTIIGDRGIRLSGGERQRLALARALLSEPQLLILDEATNALDIENENKIQEALKKLQGKLTILIIAHREVSTIHADAYIEMSGKCVKTYRNAREEIIQADAKKTLAAN